MLCCRFLMSFVCPRSLIDAMSFTRCRSRAACPRVFARPSSAATIRRRYVISRTTVHYFFDYSVFSSSSECLLPVVLPRHCQPDHSCSFECRRSANAAPQIEQLRHARKMICAQIRACERHAAARRAGATQSATFFFFHRYATDMFFCRHYCRCATRQTPPPLSPSPFCPPLLLLALSFCRFRHIIAAPPCFSERHATFTLLLPYF